MENSTPIDPQVKQEATLAPKVAPQAPLINLDHIKDIESSGDPLAFNRYTKARGLYQITPIALEDWNQNNKMKRYSRDDLFNPKVNHEIADWYMNHRIPQMLTSYKKPVTVDNILASYNFGIGHVVDNAPLPKETKDYIKKYYSKMGGTNAVNPTVS